VSDDLMEQVRVIHITFYEAQEQLVKDVSDLLDALDDTCVDDDDVIAKQHGEEVLEAFYKVNRSWLEAVKFFPSAC